MDELTGLPELSEGHHWNVRESDWETLYRISQHNPDFKREDHRYRVSIIRSWEGSHIDAKKHWWSKQPELEITMFSEAVMFEYMAELTPDSIRATAEKVLENWEAKKAREALLGNYPPKKLES